MAGCGATTRSALVNVPAPGKTPNLRAGDNLVVQLQSILDPADIQAQIDDQGFISLRYIGQIKAEGLTESALADKIRRTYTEKKIYPKVDVSVSVTQRFIYVGGEVGRPGRVAWSPDLTLTKAVQAAGGFGLYADKKGVLLSRDNRSFRVNAKNAERFPSSDPKLYPGDSITVNRSMM